MSEAADIEAQAAAWIARCDALGCDHDPQLAAWLIADPRHRAAYLRLAHAWERTQRLARLRPADRSVDPDLLAPPRPTALGAWLRPRAAGPAGDDVGGARVSRARALRPWTLRLAAAAPGMAAAVIVLLWHLVPSSSAQT